MAGPGGNHTGAGGPRRVGGVARPCGYLLRVARRPV